MNIRPEVKDLFRQLADLDKEEQSRYFREHPTDPAIRRQVELLLACDLSTDYDLRNLVQEQARAFSNFPERIAEGSLCGPYRLLKEIGRGGMGEVWVAERVDQMVKRRVALKLPYAGIHAVQFAERTHRERDILASLVHPGIARSKSRQELHPCQQALITWLTTQVLPPRINFEKDHLWITLLEPAL